MFTETEKFFKSKCCVKKFVGTDELYSLVGVPDAIVSATGGGGVNSILMLQFDGQDLVTAFNNAAGYILITDSTDGINKLIPYMAADLNAGNTRLFVHPFTDAGGALAANIGNVRICLWQNLVHNFNTEKNLIVHGSVTGDNFSLPNGGTEVEINGGLLEIIDTNEIAWNPWPLIPPIAANQLDGTEEAEGIVRRITDL